MNHQEPASPTISAREHWDQMYGEKEQRWSGKANAALVNTISGIAPGTALDVGCGEGGDSIWLAEQGWSVTGLDVSTTALARAEAAAKDRGVASQIEWQQRDLTEQLPTGTFDLVSSIFLQSRIEFPREEILRELTGNVAEGGLFLVVSHAEMPPWANSCAEQPELELEHDHEAGHDGSAGHNDDAGHNHEAGRNSSLGHDHTHDDLPTATETLDYLALADENWEVLICDELSREATGPDGSTAELVDVVVLVRRIAN